MDKKIGLYISRFCYRAIEGNIIFDDFNGVIYNDMQELGKCIFTAHNIECILEVELLAKEFLMFLKKKGYKVLSTYLVDKHMLYPESCDFDNIMRNYLYAFLEDYSNNKKINLTASTDKFIRFCYLNKADFEKRSFKHQYINYVREEKLPYVVTDVVGGFNLSFGRIDYVFRYFQQPQYGDALLFVKPLNAVDYYESAYELIGKSFLVNSINSLEDVATVMAILKYMKKEAKQYFFRNESNNDDLSCAYGSFDRTIALMKEYNQYGYNYNDTIELLQVEKEYLYN